MAILHRGGILFHIYVGLCRNMTMYRNTSTQSLSRPTLTFTVSAKCIMMKGTGGYVSSPWPEHGDKTSPRNI